MKKTTIMTSLFFLAMGTILATGLSVDVSGEWEISMETPRGERTQKMTITQDGETITVTMTSQRGDVEGEGIIKGNKIEWTVTRSTQRGEFTIAYKGTVDGDSMSGEVQIGDFGARQWTAKRIK